MKLLLALLLFCSSVYAEQIQCVDTLAAAQYGDQLRHLPVQYGIRGFARKEFGDFFPVAKKELERGRPWVGINLLWSDTHTFGDKDLPFVKNEAARYEPLCERFPGKIELTTFTEHNLQNPDKYHDAVQAVAPHCRIINSVYKGAFSRKYKNEVHGTHNPPPFGPFNFSFDGTNAFNSNVAAFLKKHAAAEVFCIWTDRDNLRYREKDTASRAQRVKEAKQRSPDQNMLLSQVYLFSNPGPISIPKGWLVKSHAEKHNAGDLKGDKLLIISPVKGKTIELKRNGKVIATLTYYGVFDGGGYRYYWNKFGYTAGASLDIFIGKKKFGIMNGGFRAGGFR